MLVESTLILLLPGTMRVSSKLCIEIKLRSFVNIVKNNLHVTKFSGNVHVVSQTE